MIPIDPANAMVFVVEDNADNIWVLERALKKAGVTRFNARASGRYLFQWLDENPGRSIDLVLLDLHIPREDGYEVLQQIRSHPTLQSACVIAVTANVMPQDVERCRISGFDGFIGKPTDPRRLPEQLQRIMAGEQVWEPR
jgi:two-component system, cell cycle response regulator DivK